MDAMLRFIFMSHKFLNLAHRVANFPECTMLVDSTLDTLGKQIEDKINAYTGTFEDPTTVPTNATSPNELLINARLKKKDVQTKSSKRQRNWLDKKPKSGKKRKNKATSQGKKQWYDMKNNSILVYYSCLSEPFVFVFLMIQHVGEDPSNDGAQAKIAGDSVSDYLALHGPIIDDFDGEQALMDKEKDSNEKMALKSFTQLLTGPISDDLLTGDLL